MNPEDFEDSELAKYLVPGAYVAPTLGVKYVKPWVVMQDGTLDCG